MSINFSGSGGASELAVSKTITLAVSDTTAQKQAQIDSIARVAKAGTVLAIQLANGSHVLDAPLKIRGFRYPVVMQGNLADATGLSTVKSVTLDASAVAGNAVEVEDCSFVKVDRLKILFDSSNNYTGVRGPNCTEVAVVNCFLQGNSIANGNCIYCLTTPLVFAENNFVSNSLNGIQGYSCGLITSRNNDDTGTLPAYGLYANTGTTIAKRGTQPAGSTANEQGSGINGALIR